MGISSLFLPLSRYVGDDRPSKLENLKTLDFHAAALGYLVPPTWVLDVEKLHTFQCFRSQANLPLLSTDNRYRFSNDERRQIGDALNLLTFDSRQIIVRSMCDLEDSRDGAAFSGIFHTEVTNADSGSLLNAIQRVLCSIFSERATQALKANHKDRYPNITVALQPHLGGSQWVGGTGRSLVEELRPMEVHAVSIGTTAANVTSGIEIPEEHFISKRTAEKIAWSPGDSRLGHVDASAVASHVSDTLKRLEAVFANPIEIEWMRNQAGSLVVLQARELSISARNQLPPPSIVSVNKQITSGQAVGSGRVVGNAFVTDKPTNGLLTKREILVSPGVGEQWSLDVAMAGGFVTTNNSRHSHLSNIARAHDVLAAVACDPGVSEIVHGQKITLVCVEGMQAVVLPGVFEQERVPFQGTLRVTHPSQALSALRNFTLRRVEIDLLGYFDSFLVDYSIPSSSGFIQSRFQMMIAFAKEALSEIATVEFFIPDDDDIASNLVDAICTYVENEDLSQCPDGFVLNVPKRPSTKFVAEQGV